LIDLLQLLKLAQREIRTCLTDENAEIHVVLLLNGYVNFIICCTKTTILWMYKMHTQYLTENNILCYCSIIAVMFGE